jgi:hypothetical protein
VTHWKVLVSNSETLSAADLGEHAPTVTISGVEGGAFEGENGKTDKTALITFTGRDKKLAAKTINCELIAAMFGEEVEAWIGHAITLMVDKVEVAGQFKGQPCIRIKGSPELRGPVTVDIKLPRRKPIQRTLIPTSKGNRDSVHVPEESNVENDVLGASPSMFGGDA